MERNCTIRVAKTKMLISFAVTFVFVYAAYWISHEAAYLSVNRGKVTSKYDQTGNSSFC